MRTGTLQWGVWSMQDISYKGTIETIRPGLRYKLLGRSESNDPSQIPSGFCSSSSLLNCKLSDDYFLFPTENYTSFTFQALLTVNENVAHTFFLSCSTCYRDEFFEFITDFFFHFCKQTIWVTRRKSELFMEFSIPGQTLLCNAREKSIFSPTPAIPQLDTHTYFSLNQTR